MNRKEVMDLLLSKVAEDRKEAFISEFRAAKTVEERLAVAKKYDATLTDEQVRTIKAEAGNTLGDEQLDQASGGCCKCSCTSRCTCNCQCAY